MDKSLDDRLRQSHEQFNQCHDMLRERLLATVADRRSPVRRRSSYAESTYEYAGLRWRLVGRVAAVAAAAMVMICAGLLMPGSDQAQLLSPQAAYAAAIDNVGSIDSVHFRMITPGRSGGQASLEGWWRRPHDFRMEFDSGSIMTGNDTIRCQLSNNELTIRKAEGPSLEMLLLGELGPFFPAEAHLTRAWESDRKLVSSTKVQYKGEACLNIVVEAQGRRYEYIVNEKASEGKTPLIYEVHVYSGGESPRLMQRVEVLGIDREMPESLFRITPGKDMTVIDRRQR